METKEGKLWTMLLIFANKANCFTKPTPIRLTHKKNIYIAKSQKYRFDTKRFLTDARMLHKPTKKYVVFQMKPAISY